MAISNDILSSTLRILKDEEVDNLYRSIPLLDHIRKSGGVETVDGGSKLSRPMILAEHSQLTQLSTGYEPINLSAADVLREQNYEWQDAVQPIIITKKEELSNKGPRAIVSIAEARMKGVMGQFKREFEKALVAASSTVLTELSSLNGQAQPVNGFLDNLIFGSQNNTIGGIAQTSFANDFQHQYAEITAFTAGGTETIDALTDVYVACQTHTPDGSTPQLILTSADFFKKYKAQLYNNQRFVDTSKLDGGILALAFHGAAMHVSPVMTTLNAGNTGPSGNNDYYAAFCLNPKFLKLVYDTDAEFAMTDFMNATGYASRYAYVCTRVQMVVDHLASQGVVTIDQAL